MSAVKMTILGSGSDGNCAYVETPKIRLLVDAGFSGRQIEQRLQGIGRTLDDIQAVLITHEHTDHVAGLAILANKKQIPVYTNRLTADFLRARFPQFNQWKIFRTGEEFDLEDLHVETFSVPHDAYDPVGYTISFGQQTIGFLTDLGYATRLVVERVKSCSALVLETNHDLQLLRADTKRPWAVKQRILARHGHLSNDAAAELAGAIASDRLQHLYLSHLSEDCNTPELARQAIQSKLDALNITHISVHDTTQNIPNPTLELVG
ncbi:MAG: MBL fold metallo-hydrolase [Verrucomicrobiota bacterium]